MHTMRILGVMGLTACGAAPQFDKGDTDGVGNGEYGDRGDSGVPSFPGDTGSADDDFADHGTNPWVEVSTESVSTFGVDVDSASYTIMRRRVNAGGLPDPASVRTEEYLNYFRYDDARPPAGEPFAVDLEAGPSMFGEDGHKLLRIHLQAEEVAPAERKAANLVFLLDVSGSMQSPDKLELMVWSMKQLVDKLGPEDTLGIVVYAGQDRVILSPTPVSDKSAILDALDALASGGSTNGEGGIRKAYQLAESAMKPGGINRVVLATDGDFNVGLTGPALVSLIEDFRDRGIFLTTLGFGMGNLGDATLEQLADNGNGNYGYIDTRAEALRMLGENLVSSLQVVAKDVKIQVAFEPEAVRRWRLIGYENRVLENEDFEDDTKDAGEIGAGHGVTALYEIELADAPTGPLAEVRLRHKAPDGDDSELQTRAIEVGAIVGDLDDTTGRFRWGAAVAEYAEILRTSPHSEGARFEDLIELAAGAYPASERDAVETEFLGLAAKAAEIHTP